MANILMTMAEEREATTSNHFAVRYRVDENDCLDFSQGLMERGHEVFFVNWDDLDDGQFTRMFHDNTKQFVSPARLEDFQLAFVYKMEGFYFDLARFFRMVAVLEQKVPQVVNEPNTIRHNLDKSYFWELAERGVRILPTFPVDEEVRRRLAEGQRFVIKPRRGERGYGIFLARAPDDLHAIAGRESDHIAQEYTPAIRKGERSLVFLGLEFQHAVIKTPPANNPEEFRCNESLGGTVAVYEPAGDEVEYAEQVLRAYESLGCPPHFSRIDLVATDEGPALVEAELLNPSIYANYSGKGQQFGKTLAAYFDRLLEPPPAQSQAPDRKIDCSKTQL